MKAAIFILALLVFYNASSAGTRFEDQCLRYANHQCHNIYNKCMRPWHRSDYVFGNYYKYFKDRRHGKKYFCEDKEYYCKRDVYNKCINGGRR